MIDTKKAFSDEEIETEHRRRRRRSVGREAMSLKLTCIHCHCDFDPAAGGNSSVPICDLCLHDD